MHRFFHFSPSLRAKVLKTASLVLIVAMLVTGCTAAPSPAAEPAANTGAESAAPAADLTGGELNVLSWCDHTDPALLAPFEEQYKVKVNVKEYDGTGVALSLVEQSQPGDWDVFVADSVEIPRLVAMGLIDALPEDQFPWDDIFPELRQENLHFHDGKLYGMPEKFGYNTVAFNQEKVDVADMRKIASLWDPKFKGRIAVYDYYIPVMEMVLIGLGKKPDQLTEADLPAIQEKLFLIKDNAATVGDVVSVQTALATGEVDIIAAGGEFATAVLSKENPALDWVLPDEGGIRWMQALALFKESKRKALGLEFMKYILSPEGQGRLATSSCFWAMPANSKAVLSDETKKVLRWDEQPTFIAKSYAYFIPDPELDAKMLEVWTEFLQH